MYIALSKCRGPRRRRGRGRSPGTACGKLGPSPLTQRRTAAKLGIDEVIADVLPDQKADVVERLRREGRREIQALGGWLPHRVAEAPPLPVPELDYFKEFLAASGERLPLLARATALTVALGVLGAIAIFGPGLSGG